MAEKYKDYLTKNLPFKGNEEPPKRGEKGYLEPGFHFDKDGNIIDEQGNIYNEGYELIKEKPSEEWLRAMELARKNSTRIYAESDLIPLARFYYKHIMAEKAKSEKKDKSRNKSPKNK